MDFTDGTPTKLLVSAWFREHATDAWVTPLTVMVKPYVRSPRLLVGAAVPNTIGELDKLTGWVPGEAIIAPTGTTNIKLRKEPVGAFDFFRLSLNSGVDDAHLEDDQGWTVTTTTGDLPVGDQEVVQALAFYLPGTHGSLVDPLLFVSTSGVGNNTVLHDGALIGTFNEKVPNEAYLVARAADGVITAGSLQVRPAVPRWESAHAEHLWLTPQRINFIANPRFANEDVVHWRAGSTGGGSVVLTRVGGARSTPYAGKVSGAGLNGARLALESNLFPVTSFWTSVSLRIRGSGTAHVGLVSWPADYRAGPTFTESIEREISPLGVVPSAPDTGLTIEWIDHDVRESSYVVCSDGRVLACWVEIQALPGPIPNQWTLCTGYVADEQTFLTDTNSVTEANEITELVQTDRSFLHASIQKIDGALYLYVDNESREDEMGYTPAVYDPSFETPPDTYGTYIYRSLDDGATWTLHGTLPVARYVATAYDGTWGGPPIGNKITVHPGTGNWVILGPEYVDTYGGNGAVGTVFYSTDDGQTWTDTSGSFGNAIYTSQYARNIAVDHNGHMYFTHSAFGRGTTLHQSTNGGVTWTNVEGYPGDAGDVDTITGGSPIVQSPWDPDQLVVANVGSAAGPNGGDLLVSVAQPPTGELTGFPGEFEETWATYRAYGLGLSLFTTWEISESYVSLMTSNEVTNLGAFVPVTGTLDQFQEIHFLAKVPQDAWELQLRIEFEGDSFWITDVLADPHEGQYEYFDGDDTSGLPNDFRWMGGLEHSHFSLWYNNEQNANARLFGLWDRYDPDTDRGDEDYKSGLLESWAPTGASFVPHWNAIGYQQPLNWVGDYFYPLVDVAGTPVTGSLTYTDEDDSVYVDEDGVPYAEA